MVTAIDRFTAKYRVDASGCWLWTAAKAGHGYGAFCIDGRQGYAHRFSYMHHVGPIPASLHVLHRCDVPSCVNPDHLFVGTVVDNSDDKIAKGRQARGSKHGHSKISLADVMRARALRASGATMLAIARSIGVCRQQAARIVRGERWRHVGAES